MSDLIDALMAAPDTQLDAAMKPYIQKWSDPPTATQVLEVLDHCIHASLASSVVVQILQSLYEDACSRSGLLHEDVVKHAIWRT